MTINYTTLLGLAKPVTGTETGQWGDVVNDQITTLLEDALANSSSISVTAGNVTLTTTTGSANQARMSTLIITGTPGTTRNVIAPSQAKIYVVINQSNAAVVVKGSATTGVTIGTGQTAQIAWNGSDFVEIGNYVHGNFVVNGNLTVNGNTTLGDAAGDTITVNGATTFANVNPTLSAGTANGVGYLNGSKVLTTGSALTFDGTTLTANALSVTNGVTLSAGTANGVLYLNGSKVATSGSALTFDGTTFATTARTSSANGAWVGSGAVMGWGAAGTFSNYIVGDTTSNYLLFQVNSAEGMRLTSTGLGIGTTTPGLPLDVIRGTAGFVSRMGFSSGVSIYQYTDANAAYISTATNLYNAFGINETSSYLNFYTANAERMRIDSSGNLGLGVTPSAWYSGAKAFQFGGNAALLNNNFNSTIFVHNAFYDTVWRYILTGQQASYYNQINGAHAWYTAPVGTAGNPITFTQAMTLDANGNLNVNGGRVRAGGGSDDGTQLNIWTTVGGEGYIAAYSIAFNTGANNSRTERARIDSSGNLLLGTTTVGTTGSSGLTVYDATQGEIRIQNSTSGTGTTKGFQLAIASSDAYLWNFQNGAMLFATNNAERARITSAGNFGIGTTNPTSALSVVGAGSFTAGLNVGSGTSASEVAIEVGAGRTGNGYAYIDLIGDATYTDYGLRIIRGNSGANADSELLHRGTGIFNIEATDSAPITFSTANTERARITSGGEFILGNTSNASYSAGVRFYAEATSLAGAFKSTVAANGTLGVWNTATSGDNVFINFYEGSLGVVVGGISYNRAGGLTSYNTTSDYRAKDIIGPVKNPGATIDGLKVYEGKMKGATQSRPMLVAHEAQAVAPYSVTGEKDAVNDKGEPVYQQMDVSSLVPLLLAEIQSLRARVAQLESK